MAGVIRHLGFMLGFAALMAAGMAFSDLLAASEPFGISPIWPPAGIAFACLLLGGLGAWPALAVGFAIGQILSIQIMGVQLPGVFIGFALAANVLSPVIAVWAVRRFWPEELIQLQMKNGMIMLLGGVLLSAIAASFGTIGATLAGLVPDRSTLAFATEWFLGDVYGVVTCAPALLSIGRVLQRPEQLHDDPAVARVSEKLLWCVFAVLAGFLWVWLARSSAEFALAVTFLPFIFLGWSALRFDHLFTTIAVMVVTLSVTVCFVQGWLGLTPPTEPLQKAVLMFFVAVMAVMPLLVSTAAQAGRIYAKILKFRAHHDPLTRMPNRSAFEDAAKAAVQRAKRQGTPSALCYLDLDNFKVVNDTCGHAAGDELIKQIAHVLESNMGSDELVARLGGDEFGFVFQEYTSDEALDRARELTRLIDQFRFVWRKNIFAFTASCGMVALDRNVRSYAHALSAVDTACYEAKDNGGNRVVVGSAREDDSGYSASMHWAVRITEALERNRFELYCQPIVALSGERYPINLEVLLRMRDENGMHLSPASFIPAAERFNLMGKVDRWVVRRALETLRRNSAALSLVDKCSINLSGNSLGDPEFLDWLTRVLTSSSVPCEKLCFEVTETAAIGDLANATTFIDRLRELGCRFALDDFGSGLSSFGYLKSLQVDYLKIDGMFIRDLIDNPLDIAVVRSINDVGHVLGKQTIAEYVETEETAKKLAELGVDYAQGHALGQAIPMEYFFEDLQIRLDRQRKEAKRIG